MKRTKQSLILNTRMKQVGEVPLNGTLLLTFKQLQPGQIRTENLPGGDLRISGDIDRLRWGDLSLVAEAIKTALVRCEIAPTESLSLWTYIDVFPRDFIMAYEIWLDQSECCLPDILEVQHVAQVMLNGITNGKDHLNDELFESIGDVQKVSTLNSLVKETLGACGGRKISSPIDVTSRDWKAQLARKIASKPDLSDHSVVPVQMTGKFVGAQTEKFELYFCDDGWS